MKKRIITSIVMIFACLTLCGAGWFNTTKVVVDTENNKVYEQCRADEVFSAFSSDSKTAKEKYGKMPVRLTAKVVSVDGDGTDLVITGMNTAASSMGCSYDKALRSEMKQYKAGDTITLYGQIAVGLFTGEVSLKVDKIAQDAGTSRSAGMYYLQNGATFDMRDAVKETLRNGDVEYYVPSAWTGKEIRHNITEENLGTMEGYQYVLNKLDASETVPESVFVCYFDKDKLFDESDVVKTEQVAKLVVENILGSAGSLSKKEVTTYYDTEYLYYKGVFKNAMETGEGYRTEFIFQADGEDGIVVVLYVYKEAKHVDDLLFLMRFLEVK